MLIMLPELFEIIMVICFGMSWPMNIMRSWRARSAKGKSILFLCFIFVGYIAGIISKLSNDAYLAQFAEKWYVLIFYFINITMDGIDILLYFSNRRLDKLAEQM